MDSFTPLKEYAEILKEYCSFMMKELAIDQLPTIAFIHNKKNAENPLGKTGFYSPGEKKITIFITNRHIKDIMRSLGHEMVHYKQDLDGRFQGNESLGQGYAQTNEYMREIEGEAYLKGSFLTRDYEDQRRMKNGQG